ncbi:uncharacterized protein DUF3347 [Gillisia sp. Hel_I_86]|uniref:DUF3347 domain-containing protein n=1 Tax=Gillisia sp. Hel_I_86 TaxID=1249981 RepID=UPI001198F5EA|nr:DUF3347 domain-containing protein [Gillisia sp. Hel_I_86]TVZ26857.1 uncharacterized protein DUF3347 [Gillisia sp. Hel_I_86]
MRRKFRNHFMLAALVAGFGFYSCIDNKDKKEETTIVVMDEEMNSEGSLGTVEASEQEEIINVQFKETSTQDIFEHYIGIKQALVASNNAEAQKHASMLLESLTEAKAGQSLVGATKQLAEAKDINKQREAFSKVTKGMETVLKGAISSGGIYKQFCPMAFEGKGDYWYATSVEIRNPYFGDKMLKCGRVEEVIN